MRGIGNTGDGEERSVSVGESTHKGYIMYLFCNFTSLSPSVSRISDVSTF